MRNQYTEYTCDCCKAVLSSDHPSRKEYIDQPHYSISFQSPTGWVESTPEGWRFKRRLKQGGVFHFCNETCVGSFLLNLATV